eukprot:5078951-Alexandrium_andersonii.AAC.1
MHQAVAAPTEPRCPDDGHGDPTTMMAKPSLLEVFGRGSLWPSSGQRGSCLLYTSDAADDM